MEESPPVGMAPDEGVPNPFGRERGRHRQVAPREALGETEKVGGYALLLAREHRAGASEAGGHLVEDQQHVVPPREIGHAPQEAGRMHVDAGSRLHERLHDDRGD